MLSFRPLKNTDFPLLLSWLSNKHVKQWWDDGHDTLEKVALHYGSEELGVYRFILQERAGRGVVPIGYFQYYIVSPDTLGIDQFIGEIDRINQGVGTTAIKLFLDLAISRHKPQQVTIDPHPDNKRAIRCYEKVGFVYYAMEKAASGESSYMMRLDGQSAPV